MSGSAGQIALWAAALIVAALLGFWGVLWMRRRILHDDAGGTVGMTLADLRRLHAQGDLSDEEFEAARLSIIGASGASGAAGGGGGASRAARTAEGFAMEAEPGKDLTGERLPGGQRPDRTL